MADYQLIVIGAGPGGYEAALRAAELGLKTAIVEKRDIGGTCLNRGCIPTKTLLHASEVVSAAREGRYMGVHGETADVNMSALFQRKCEVSRNLCKGVEELLKNANVTIYHGVATVMGSGHVRVSADSSIEELQADHILIASGGIPSMPPIPGLDLDGVMNSDELLDGAETLYHSMIIIGGGVIGVELAQFYSDLGCEVTIVEGMDRLLPNLDKELGQNLAAILKKRGVKIYTKSMVSEVTQCEDGLCVKFTQQEKAQQVIGEKVLCAIGRIPETRELFAEGVSIEMNRRQIKVDEVYETSLPGVYAIGDVSSPVQLAHVASAQGRACVEMIAGISNHVEDLSAIPNCVYSKPEIACVGMTLDEAKAAGYKAISGKALFFANARAMIIDAPRSFVKVVADVESHRVLGAQLMCPNSTDMLSEFTEAIVHHLTVEAMLRVLRPHPTFEEVISDALKNTAEKLLSAKQ